MAVTSIRDLINEYFLKINSDGSINTTATATISGPVSVTQGTTPWTVSGTVTANAGTNLNTSLLALDSTVAKDASLTTINTSINTLLKPASTLAAVTTLGSITNALPAGTNVLGHIITDAGSVVNATLSAETTKVIGTVNQGTSPWVTSINNIASIVGQTTMASSLPVVIASNQTVTPWAVQLDNTSTANVTYIGIAVVGSATSSAVWQIKKLDQTSGLVITWAGSAAYNQIWNNRTSLSYA